ncbi:MAG: hypothetical protein M3144_08015, partial [Actinomycetota bacterium]|nr:hypothetical protein [Actinomycetota bacterium]
MIKRWGEFVARRALTVVTVGILAVLGAAAYGAGVFDSLSQGGFDDPATEAARELAAEREAFGNRTVDVVAIYSSDTLSVDDPAFREAVQDVVAGIPEGVTASVTSYYDTGAEDLVSSDGHGTQVLISLGGESQNDYLENYDRLEPTLDAEGLETHLAGP